MLAKKFLISILLFLVSIFLIFNTLGASTGFTYEKVNPNDSIKYQFKRLIEKLEGTRVNVFDQKNQVKFLTTLSNRRFAELKYVVDREQLKFLEQSSSRYITQLGIISAILDKNKADSSFVKLNLENQFKAFDEIKDVFPAQSAQWLLVQQARDTANSVLSKADKLSK